MSTLLFHGPTSRDVAIEEAEKIGRLLAEPFGDDGLKVETAREIVEMLSTAPIGDQLGVVVIGPFDDVTVQASDALLKTLEEFDSRFVQPILWAMDVGSVTGTIRSRCLPRWCPALPGHSPERPYLGAAERLCEAALRRRTAAVIEHLKENEGMEGDLMRASAEVLINKEEWPLEVRLLLWESIRKTLKAYRDKPTALGALSAFLV